MDYDEFVRVLNEEDYEFDDIETKLSNKKDLHAFLVIDAYTPDERSIISGEAHDEIYIAVDVEFLALNITLKEARELSACGVMVDEDFPALCMFV